MTNLLTSFDDDRVNVGALLSIVTHFLSFFPFLISSKSLSRLSLFKLTVTQFCFKGGGGGGGRLPVDGGFNLPIVGGGGGGGGGDIFLLKT